MTTTTTYKVWAKLTSTRPGVSDQQETCFFGEYTTRRLAEECAASLADRPDCHGVEIETAWTH